MLNLVELWDAGMARLRWQLLIADNSRGYNPEFISLTVERYRLNSEDVTLAHHQNYLERLRQEAVLS